MAYTESSLSENVHEITPPPRLPAPFADVTTEGTSSALLRLSDLTPRSLVVSKLS